MLILDEKQRSLLMTFKQSINKESNEKQHIENKMTNENIHSNKIIEIAMQNKINNASNIICRRGEIFYSDLAGNVGSEQGGIRPVLIIQNDIGNRYSPIVIVAVLTTRINKRKIPTHLEIESDKLGLPKDSVVLFEQIRTLDKRRLREKICTLDKLVMLKVDKALKISVGLDFGNEQKTLLEKLSSETKQYIINKLRFIERAKESIEFYKTIKGDNDSINLAEDEKFREENTLQYFCYQNNINYKEVYKNYIELFSVKKDFVAI